MALFISVVVGVIMFWLLFLKEKYQPLDWVVDITLVCWMGDFLIWLWLPEPKFILMPLFLAVGFAPMGLLGLYTKSYNMRPVIVIALVFIFGVSGILLAQFGLLPQVKKEYCQKQLAIQQVEEGQTVPLTEVCGQVVAREGCMVVVPTEERKGLLWYFPQQQCLEFCPTSESSCP